MRYLFHEDAREEFIRSVAYYEGCSSGLGMEFAQEVYATIERIRRFPDAWPELTGNTRRSLVNRFPFGVVYQAREDTIQIIAIADLRRRPGYWKSRK